jgi:hypothetical protein
MPEMGHGFKSGPCETLGLLPAILAAQEAKIGRIEVRSQPGENSLQAPISKNPSQKRAGGVAQVVKVPA